MDIAALEDWLRRRLSRDANVCVLVSPFAVLAGLAAFALASWVTFGALSLFLRVLGAGMALAADVNWRASMELRLWLTAAFQALVVVSFLRSRGRAPDLGDWTGEPDALGRAASAWVPSGAGSTVLLALYPTFTGRLVTDLLFVAPRLMFRGVSLLQESGRLRVADARAGARMLWTLLATPRRVGYAELQELYPGREGLAALAALRHVPGVVFLEAGMTLTEELRGELRSAD